MEHSQTCALDETITNNESIGGREGTRRIYSQKRTQNQWSMAANIIANFLNANSLGVSAHS